MQILIYQKFIRNRFYVPTQGVKNKFLKSLSVTDLCENTYHCLKLMVTESRPPPPRADFNWPEGQRALPSSDVFIVVVILSGGDKSHLQQERH